MELSCCIPFTVRLLSQNEACIVFASSRGHIHSHNIYVHAGNQSSHVVPSCTMARNSKGREQLKRRGGVSSGIQNDKIIMRSAGEKREPLFIFRLSKQKEPHEIRQIHRHFTFFSFRERHLLTPGNRPWRLYCTHTRRA